MRTLSKEDPALRMTYPGFVFRTLVKEGHDPARLLADTGLTAAALADPEFQTGFPPLRQFILNAIALTGEPHLGVRLARQFEASFIGLPAYAAMNAATFVDALAVLSRFFFLTFPAIEFAFPDTDADVQPGEFAIRLRSRMPLGDVSYFASVSAVVACAKLCTAILRVPDPVLHAELGIEQPVGWDTVQAQIGFPVRFDAPDIRLFLRDALLPQALPAEDPLEHARLLALCEHVAKRTMVETTPIGRVVAFLDEGRNAALPIGRVAAALGFSDRSLRRHLERSGTTFLKLTSEIRARRARHLLAYTRLPIKTVAYELGFETPSNFARSFKQWTGSSPSAFRLAKQARDLPGRE